MRRPTIAEMRETVSIQDETRTVDPNTYQPTNTVATKVTGGVEWVFPAKIVSRYENLISPSFREGGGETEGYNVTIKNPRVPNDGISTNELLKWRDRLYKISGITYEHNDDFIVLGIQKQGEPSVGN